METCPKCGSKLEQDNYNHNYDSSLLLFYPRQRKVARKQTIIFKDPLDGELYEIWKCTNCLHSWDSLEEGIDKK